MASSKLLAVNENNYCVSALRLYNLEELVPWQGKQHRLLAGFDCTFQIHGLRI